MRVLHQQTDTVALCEQLHLVAFHRRRVRLSTSYHTQHTLSYLDRYLDVHLVLMHVQSVVVVVDLLSHLADCLVPRIVYIVMIVAMTRNTISSTPHHRHFHNSPVLQL